MWHPKSRSSAIIACAIASGALFSAYLYLSQSSRVARPTFPFSLVSDQACNEIAVDTGINDQPRHAIPHIVHYIWLLKNPAELRLSFKFFVSVYSAHLFWRPERIYIHTDATPETFARAKTDGSTWTKRILAIPGMTPNYVDAPLSTSKGVDIINMEHKADFLRIEALRQFGGTYLDVDAVPLRDISSLWDSGFANVLGGATALTMKHSGYINNGVMMSVPNSTLMGIYYHAAHEFFDGSWATASIHLLTDLANRLLPVPSEVLVLQPQAFAPTSWEVEDQKQLFMPYFDSVPTAVTTGSQVEDLRSTCKDALAWLREREYLGANSLNIKEKNRWELDFSSSYVLHAFDDQINKIRGWDHQIDLRYVLARQSNYARAVYPAVRHAIEAGTVSLDEVQ